MSYFISPGAVHKTVAAGALGLSVMFLSACGQGTVDTASDPVPSPSSTPTPSVEPSEAPEEQRMFEEQNYNYTVVFTCFCPDAGAPIDIEVRDGKVVSAKWAGKEKGMRPIQPWQKITIADMLEQAYDENNDRVDIKWPEDQAWPNSIWIDPQEMAVDEESGYTIRNVEIVIVD